MAAAALGRVLGLGMPAHQAGLDVTDERSTFDPATRTIRSFATLVVTNTTGATITGPLAATILIDKAGVVMPLADGADDIGNPVFFVAEDGDPLAADATATVELEFTRTAPTAFLFDVQLVLGDPTVVVTPQTATPLRPLAVLPRTSDTDGDRWHDLLDVCPTRPDPEQLDLDGDGVGDACQALVGVRPGPGSEPPVEPDRTPPVSRPSWIRIQGTAPAGAIRVTLNGVGSEVDETGHFEIASPIGAEQTPLELIFSNADGPPSTRFVDIQIAPADQEPGP